MWSTASGIIRSAKIKVNGKPIIVTEEEWHAMQAKISELYDAIPELKFK